MTSHSAHAIRMLCSHMYYHSSPHLSLDLGAVTQLETALVPHSNKHAWRQCNILEQYWRFARAQLRGARFRSDPTLAWKGQRRVCQKKTQQNDGIFLLPKKKSTPGREGHPQSTPQGLWPHLPAGSRPAWRRPGLPCFHAPARGGGEGRPTARSTAGCQPPARKCQVCQGWCSTGITLR